MSVSSQFFNIKTKPDQTKTGRFLPSSVQLILRKNYDFDLVVFIDKNQTKPKMLTLNTLMLSQHSKRGNIVSDYFHCIKDKSATKESANLDQANSVNTHMLSWHSKRSNIISNYFHCIKGSFAMRCFQTYISAKVKRHANLLQSIQSTTSIKCLNTLLICCDSCQLSQGNPTRKGMPRITAISLVSGLNKQRAPIMENRKVENISLFMEL